MSMAPKFSWPAGYQVDRYHEQHPQLHLANWDLGKGTGVARGSGKEIVAVSSKNTVFGTYLNS